METKAPGDEEARVGGEGAVPDPLLVPRQRVLQRQRRQRPAIQAL